ncbi:hypothetical protein ACFSW8_07180 [Rubritalea tangerina]|uniref:DUF4178 domain-containing protein n=2 Tax=Rubritalea tangerina TaxID=430798 RepID=A0ABW4Z9Q9_9BACT
MFAWGVVNSLEARIKWRSLRWWKAIKWPSAHEVDFGGFTVSFGFKDCEVWVHGGEDGGRCIASLPKQDKVQRLSDLKGELICGSYRVVIEAPLVSEDGEVHAIIRDVDGGEEVGAAALEGDLESGVRYGEQFVIWHRTESRDAYLEVAFVEEVSDLAILVTSLLVFARFSAGGGDVG